MIIKDVWKYIVWWGLMVEVECILLGELKGYYLIGKNKTFGDIDMINIWCFCGY